MNETSGWQRWIAGLSLFATLILFSLIATGVFDPKPVGPEKWRRTLTPREVPAQSRQIFWLDRPLPDANISLHLEAAYLDGDADSGYGLVIGDDIYHLAVAVSSLGYVAIWLQQEQSTTGGIPELVFILPWQTWPHVRTGHQVNEIWLDRLGDHLIIRVNRELLWQGAVEGLTGRVGLIGESFGGKTTIDYRQLKLFAD